MDSSSLLQRLPLPLAQLLRRSLNGKSAVERHNNAYYLAEAALKLAAIARIGVWLERCLDPESRVARELEVLVMPSIGHWCGFLRSVDRALAERKDAAMLPLGDAVGRLEKKRAEWDGVRALARAAAEAGAVGPEVAQKAQRRGILGFFELVTAYRNEVIAHGAQRRGAHYDRFASLLLEALGEVLARAELLGGMHLAHARLRTAQGDTATELRWQDLTGLAGLPLGDGEARRLGGESIARAVPGRLYLLGSGSTIPLYPLAVYREDELENEAVGMLNRTVRRRKRKEGVDELRRADYLDYTTGENLPGVDSREALTSLLSRLRDRPVSSDEVRAVEDASIAASEVQRPEETVAAGSAIGGFELEGEVGRGGMGIVYKARQRSLNRIVALKVLPPALAADETTVARFRREIAALAKCDHPNVVKILTSGVDGDRYYYAMEYVDGADLGRVSRVLTQWKTGGATLREGHISAAISSSGADGPRLAQPSAPAGVDEEAAEGEASEEEPIPIPEIPPGRDLTTRLAEMFADAADGLEHLHQQGVVHRDIKPGNLMLTTDGQRIVVMDLGLAKVADGSQSLTKSDVKVLGTLRYMAPEQLRRKREELDHRVDVYGLGATLYELATGRAIFDGDTETRILHQVLEEEPVAARRVERAIPRDLSTILTVATEKDPARRYQTAGALAADLRAFSRRQPIAASPPSVIRRVGMAARRWRAATAVLLTLAMLAAGGGLYWWDWTRLKVEHCANHVFRWGVPECVTEVSEEVQRGRWVTHRLYRQRGRVVKMERVNGSGRLIPEEEDEMEETEFSSWEYLYTESDRVREVVARNRHGYVQWRERYSDDLKKVERWDRNNNPMARSGDSDEVAFREYDSRGNVSRAWYANLRGAPRPDGGGAFGYQYERDARGLASASLVLGRDRKVSFRRDGLARTTWERDSAGNVVEETYFGVGEERILVEGVWRRRSEYDDRGNEIERSCFGLDDKPSLHKDGYARRVWTFDPAGNAVKVASFGSDGEPTLDKGTGVAGWTADFDERGNRTLVSFFGLDGKPTLSKEGIAGIRKIFDPDDNPIVETKVGLDGRPVRAKDGVAIKRDRYDSRGRAAGGEFFAPDGETRALGKGGFAGSEDSYDDRGRLVARRYIGIDGQPALDNCGHAGWSRLYDDRGLVVRYEHHGPDGKLILSKEGVAGWTMEHDENGKEIRREYFDAEGKGTTYKDGYAIWERKYDALGNATESTYRDIDGSLVPHKAGNAIYRLEYDDRGNVLRRSYFRVDGKPTLVSPGCAASISEYDERGRETKHIYLGLDGKPSLAEGQVAGWTAVFDDGGNETARAFFDADEKPALYKGGYASYHSKFDERGFEIERSHRGLDGRPTLLKKGYASWTAKHDKRGNETASAFFDTDGKPTLLKGSGVAAWRSSFDDRDNEIERRYYGADGRPTLHKDGNSSWRKEYDERKNETRARYYGIDGKPTLVKEHYAGWDATYDDYGRLESVTYVGTDGEPTLIKYGYASKHLAYDARGNETEQIYRGLDGRIPAGSYYISLHKKYDARGNETRRTLLNEDGEPKAVEEYRYNARGHLIEKRITDASGALSPDTRRYAIIRYGRDPLGRLTNEAYLGLDEEPVVLRAGYASYAREYDERGRLVKESYFDAEGRPVTKTPGGYAGFKDTYDELGRHTERAYFGVDGMPARRDDGEAGWKKTYDPRGRVTRLDYLDEHRRPVTIKSGFASLEKVYDPKGRVKRLVYLDELGNPKLQPEGYASRESTYDDHGRETGRVFFDEEGRPTRVKQGYASWKKSYDTKWRVKEQAFFDEDGKPALTKEGFASWKESYDDGGRHSEKAFFGVDGAPIVGADGRIGELQTYLFSGNALDPLWSVRYDAERNPVSGYGWDKDGDEFRWTKEGSIFVLRDDKDKPITDDSQRLSLETRARAYCAGYRALRLRKTSPELFEGSGGILVLDYEPESKARELGIRPGDVLLKLDGGRLHWSLAVSVSRDREVPLVLLREGRRLTFDVPGADLGLYTTPLM